MYRTAENDENKKGAKAGLLAARREENCSGNMVGQL